MRLTAFFKSRIFVSKIKQDMKQTIISVLIVLAVSVISCHKPVNNSIIGKWKKDTQILTVNDNNTQHGDYSIPGDPTHTTYSVDGNYNITNGNTFTFVNLSGVSSCPMGDTGVYTFTVDNDQLTLVLVSDQCAGRGNFTPGVYTRQ